MCLRSSPGRSDRGETLGPRRRIRRGDAAPPPRPLEEPAAGTIRYCLPPVSYITGEPANGTTRAVHAVLHGDPVVALQRNPLTVVALVVLAAGFAMWARRLWRGEARSWVAPPWVLYGLLGVILSFWALRNVPGWTWLSPA